MLKLNNVSKNETGRKDLLDAFVDLLSRDGFNATLDQPSCFVYKELMQYYPDAKVLLTQRDASSWARSMVEMAYSVDIILYQPPFNFHPDRVVGPFGNWSKAQLGIRREEVHMDGIKDSDNPLERKSSMSLAICKRAYNDYQNKVIQDVPSHKLVQYSVKDGWKPLCDSFLPHGQSCPSHEAFPRTNTAETSFLLAWKREAQIRTIMYRIHPWLSGKRVGKIIYHLRYKHKSSILTTILIAIATTVFFAT